ncbi:glycoside hydrolase family 76 protein [Legionella lansingensis]|nr:glycoside hydrolase family 76 protein [Legionella lansingensis]
MHKVIISIAVALFFFYLPLQASTATHPLPSTVNRPLSKNENQEFRDMVIAYVRAVANHKILHLPLAKSQLNERWGWNPWKRSNWSVQVVIYYHGNKIGEGSACDNHLEEVVQIATEKALAHTTLPKITAKELAEFRFQVSFAYYPTQYYAFIEYLDKGLELLGNRVAIRLLDTQLIKQQLINSQHYLLNLMHPMLHGYGKFYNAKEDIRPDQLRTIYSSSSLYTFIKLYHFNHNQQLEKHFKSIANFILSMQVPSGPNAGGFYYSYNLKTNQKSNYIVVGTTAKTIFTLLELYQLYNEETYLIAAKKAGDWLLSMVSEDGKVTVKAKYENNIWQYKQQQSFLYSGQVLSALSRLYAVTKDQRYYDGATKIAKRLKDEAEKQNLFVGDDYRDKNTISTSWVLMSMIDYAKINQDEVYRELIRQLSNVILSMQITNSHDAYVYGRYWDATTPSGNGWLNEVIGNLYEFCKNTHLTDCQQYRKPMILTARWLIQNAYTKANTYDVKNPSQAIGGFITLSNSQTVRTDAVCHGVNSLISLLNIVGDKEQVLLVVPERPLTEILPSLREGNGFS